MSECARVGGGVVSVTSAAEFVVSARDALGDDRPFDLTKLVVAP